MTLTPMDRTFKQKISKETVVLKDTIDQLNLIDIYRSLHPKPVEYKSFSRVHGTFSRIDHMLGYKTNLNKFKRIKIISRLFFFFLDHSSMKLEINFRRKWEKKTIWRINNTYWKKWVNEEIKEEIRRYLKTNENGNTTLHNLWDATNTVLRGKFIAIRL